MKKRYTTRESKREKCGLRPLVWNLANEGPKFWNKSTISDLVNTQILGISCSENELKLDHFQQVKEQGLRAGSWFFGMLMQQHLPMTAWNCAVYVANLPFRLFYISCASPYFRIYCDSF